jgi:hypothetical protein
MSDQYQDEILKDISKNIKDIKEQLITKNKIDSINLVFNLASESTFKNKTNKEIKTIVPVVSSTLKAINESIYDN